MGNNNDWGAVGTDDPIVSLIRSYYPSYPDGVLGDLTTDPETALLAILVEQERDSNIVTSEQSSSTPSTASYFAETVTVTADGPRVTDDQGNLVEPEWIDGKQIDAGASFSEWDVRGFSNDINIAFKEPAREHRDILYRAADEPVVGTPAETQHVWLWRPDGGANSTVYIEGWS